MPNVEILLKMKKEPKKKSIEDLAEEIAFDTFPQHSIIDPYKIADQHGIKVVGGNYGDFFKGFIQYKEAQFRIFLNLDILHHPNYEFSRFTCAHELAHAFIREHRERLMKGESLAFKTNQDEFPRLTYKKFEQQAQEFAASLLMPKSRFIEKINQGSENDNLLEYIYTNLKTEFSTSMQSTAIRFTKLCNKTCVFLYIREGRFWQSASSKFDGMFNEKIYYTYNPNRNRLVVDATAIQPGGYEYEIGYVNLSQWVNSIVPGGSRDLFLKEEIIYTERCIMCMLTLEE